MTEYKNIKNEVIADSETCKNNTAFYILNGYMPTWAAEHHGAHSDFYIIEKEG